MPNVKTRHPALGLSRPVDSWDFRAGYMGCLGRLDRPQNRQSAQRRQEPSLPMLQFHFRMRVFLHVRVGFISRLRGFDFFLLSIGEAYHGVSDGGASGIDSADWIWFSECPVRPKSASAFSSLKSLFSERPIAQINADSIPSFLLWTVAFWVIFDSFNSFPYVEMYRWSGDGAVTELIPSIC